MKRIVLVSALIAGLLIALPLGSAPRQNAGPSTGPNTSPNTCTGYPEPRVYLENQSWWEPQNGPPAPAKHPGTGKQGHIHVETCFPAYQTFSGSGTLGLDITVRLHNMPGLLADLRVLTYGDSVESYIDERAGKRCPTADCAFNYHVDLPLAKAQYSGLHAVLIKARVSQEPRRRGARPKQRNMLFTLPYWPIYLKNGKPLPPADSVAADAAAKIEQFGLIGDTQYPAANGGVGDYAHVAINKADVPWSIRTGKYAPKSGVWQPTVRFEANTGFVYIDPALHAKPPSNGTVVFDRVVFHGPGAGPNVVKKLRIDTTKLTNGQHRLLIGTCNTHTKAGGDHCGTLVIRFEVQNGGAGG